MSDITKMNVEETVSSDEQEKHSEDTTVVEDMADFDLSDISYDTLKVSKILGVQESTVRKYCALMVKHGYRFHKNRVGHRIFYEHDIEVMRDIIGLKNEGVMLEEAVKIILNAYQQDMSLTTDVALPFNRLLKEFENFRKVQEEFNHQLVKKLETQNDYIKKMIEERDRRLMQSIRQTMELKQQNKKKKSFFGFFKK